MTNRPTKDRLAKDWRVAAFAWLAVGLVWTALTVSHHSWMRWEAIVGGICIGIGVCCLFVRSQLLD